MKRMWILFVALGLLLFTVGCGGGSSKGAEPSGKSSDPKAAPEASIGSEPVTVKFATSNGMFPEEDFQKYIVAPVKKKYPQITVEKVNTSDKGNSLTELVAAGTIPDIVTSYPGKLGSTLSDLQILYNLDPLIKKFKFDINRFQPEAMETVKIAGGQDYFVGLPAYTNSFALFYNKDIFDKFGVSYPKDGMYWEDVVELAKKLTRNEGGVQYRGIFPDGIGRIQQQQSIPFADFKTNKSLVNTDSWQEAFRSWGSLFMIPGLTEGDFKAPSASKNQAAFKSGTLAMIASHSSTLFDLRTNPQLNWDMVTYPQFKKAPGIGQRLDAVIMAVTEQSKVKDAAFLVMSTMLSDEVQTDMIRSGRTSVLKDSKIKQEFGKAIPEFSGKNVVAMTQLKFAVMTPFKYLPDGDVDKILTAAFNAYIVNEKDLNTALREADEAMNKLISDKLKR